VPRWGGPPDGPSLLDATVVNRKVEILTVEYTSDASYHAEAEPNRYPRRGCDRANFILQGKRKTLRALGAVSPAPKDPSSASSLPEPEPSGLDDVERVSVRVRESDVIVSVSRRLFHGGPQSEEPADLLLGVGGIAIDMEPVAGARTLRILLESQVRARVMWSYSRAQSAEGGSRSPYPSAAFHTAIMRSKFLQSITTDPIQSCPGAVMGRQNSGGLGQGTRPEGLGPALPRSPTPVGGRPEA
jgi:hypothetical protein